MTKKGVRTHRMCATAGSMFSATVAPSSRAGSCSRYPTRMPGARTTRPSQFSSTPAHTPSECPAAVSSRAAANHCSNAQHGLPRRLASSYVRQLPRQLVQARHPAARPALQLQTHCMPLCGKPIPYCIYVDRYILKGAELMTNHATHLPGCS